MTVQMTTGKEDKRKTNTVIRVFNNAKRRLQLMKRAILAVLLVCVLGMSLCACGRSNQEEPKETTETNEAKEEEKEDKEAKEEETKKIEDVISIDEVTYTENAGQVIFNVKITNLTDEKLASVMFEYGEIDHENTVLYTSQFGDNKINLDPGQSGYVKIYAYADSFATYAEDVSMIRINHAQLFGVWNDFSTQQDYDYDEPYVINVADVLPE